MDIRHPFLSFAVTKTVLRVHGGRTSKLDVWKADFSSYNMDYLAMTKLEYIRFLVEFKFVISRGQLPIRSLFAKNHAPQLVKIIRRSCPKRPELWRKRRRCGGINTASQASNYETHLSQLMLFDAY